MLSEHHTRGLRVLACRVRNIKTLDVQLVQIVGGQIERLSQRPGAGLLRTFFGQQAGQLQFGVFFGHFQPYAAVLAGLRHGADFHARLCRQGGDQRFVHPCTQDQQWRHGHADVMLRQECLEHLNLDRSRRFALFQTQQVLRILNVNRKVRPVAQMPPTPHHGQVHAGAAALHTGHEDVGIGVDRRVHRLLVQDARQRRQLVADLCGKLKLQPLGVRHHSCFHLAHQCLGLAAQKLLGVLHIGFVVLGTDQVDAWARATLDLEQQTWPRAVGKHRVLTGAQSEDFLDQLDRLLDRPGTGKGAKVTVLLFHRTSVIRHTRVMLRLGGGHDRRHYHAAIARELEVGVTLVIPKQDVEARVERLDQVVFQQQRLGLGSHYRGFHAHNLADHVANAGAPVVLLEITRHPALEVQRLAHIQQLVLRVKVAVHPRQGGQGGNLREQSFIMGVRHGGYCL